jgi:hypothetical protein
MATSESKSNGEYMHPDFVQTALLFYNRINYAWQGPCHTYYIKLVAG